MVLFLPRVPPLLSETRPLSINKAYRRDTPARTGKCAARPDGAVRPRTHHSPRGAQRQIPVVRHGEAPPVGPTSGSTGPPVTISAGATAPSPMHVGWAARRRATAHRRAPRPTPPRKARGPGAVHPRPAAHRSAPRPLFHRLRLAVGLGSPPARVHLHAGRPIVGRSPPVRSNSQISGKGRGAR